MSTEFGDDEPPDSFDEIQEGIKRLYGCGIYTVVLLFVIAVAMVVTCGNLDDIKNRLIEWDEIPVESSSTAISVQEERNG